MIDEPSLNAVASAEFGPHFIRPLYESYCFTRIPDTVRAILAGGAPALPLGNLAPAGQHYDRVVLLLVDAFGWRFFAQYAHSHPFLRRAVTDGHVVKLTSQFPSTTAAHVTTIHTGLPPGRSGVYEWFYYEPQLDAVIAPLLFSYAGDRERNTLSQAGVRPETLFPTRTLYHDLAASGIESFVFQHAVYARSPFTQVVTSGSTVMAYHTLPEAIVMLSKLIERERGPAYYFLYYDAIDSTCHLHGPESPHLAAEIDTFLDIAERQLHPRLAAAPGRTLLLLTADHGQTALDPATAFYVNKQIPQLLPMIKTNRRGDMLAPAGSARDMFLHIKPEQLDDAHALLRRHLEGQADVLRVDESIARGFFGIGTPAPVFLHKAPDLVVLPYLGHAVWWHEQGRFGQHFRGSHGGLTRDEMETLLLAQAY